MYRNAFRDAVYNDGNLPSLIRTDCVERGPDLSDRERARDAYLEVLAAEPVDVVDEKVQPGEKEQKPRNYLDKFKSKRLPDLNIALAYCEEEEKIKMRGFLRLLTMEPSSTDHWQLLARTECIEALQDAEVAVQNMEYHEKKHRLEQSMHEAVYEWRIVKMVIDEFLRKKQS